MKKLGSLLLLLIGLGACSPDAPKQYLQPFVPDQKVVDENTTESFDPKADILFVVDNSGSMDVHQDNLARNIGIFTSILLKTSILDFNLSVVSTDTDGNSSPCCGRFAGRTRVVTKATPNANSILASNLRLGTGGSGYERMFDPIAAALSPPLESGWNAGFLRKDAALIVIFLTDAEDQSEDNPRPDRLYKFLVDLKGGDKRKVLGFGVIVPSGVTNCTRDPALRYGDPPPEPERIEEFLSLMANAGSNILSLCATDYGQRLGQFALDVVSNVSSVIYLSRAPAVETIHVTYGALELPKDARTGWSYNAAENSIHLGPDIDFASQPIGSHVQVQYNAAHFKDERP